MDFLVGSKIQRIDSPVDGIFVFTLFRKGEKFFFVLSLRDSRFENRVGLLKKRPHGNPASTFVRKLRKELTGARSSSFEILPNNCFRWHFQRYYEGTSLWFTLISHPEGGLQLFSEQKLLVSLYGRHLAQGQNANAMTLGAEQGGITPVCSMAQLYAQGSEILKGVQSDAQNQLQQTYCVQLRKLRKRLTKKKNAIENDLKRAAFIPELQDKATLLLSNLDSIQKAKGKRSGRSSIEVVDWRFEPPQKVLLNINPALNLHEQAEKWFHLAKRYKRGEQIAQSRLQQVQAFLDEVEALQDRISAPNQEIIEEIDVILQKTAFGSSKIGWRPQKNHIDSTTILKSKRVPFRQYKSVDGLMIKVGKSARDNDTMLSKFSKPNDLWLHVRDGRGAHVVVHLEKHQNCPPETLIDAASLAVHFSDLKNEAFVDVQYTSRKFVVKNKKLSPGQVIVQREKVLHLRLQRNRIQRLLNMEIK